VRKRLFECDLHTIEYCVLVGQQAPNVHEGRRCAIFSAMCSVPFPHLHVVFVCGKCLLAIALGQPGRGQ